MTDEQLAEIRDRNVAWIHWGDGDLRQASRDRAHLLAKLAERDAEIERLQCKCEFLQYRWVNAL